MVQITDQVSQSRLRREKELTCLSSVYAIFNALVRVIDGAKREALRRLLLENVMSTSPNEKLDEKLAMLSLVNERDICTSIASSPGFY